MIDTQLDFAVRGVCREKFCSASITILDGNIIKINGNEVDFVNDISIQQNNKNNHITARNNW